MMLGQFIAQPCCSKTSQWALINKLILCITIFDQKWIQPFIISFKATLLTIWCHGRVGLIPRRQSPALSINIDRYLHKYKAPGNQRGLAKITGPTAGITQSVPYKPAGDGGEAHRYSLLRGENVYGHAGVWTRTRCALATLHQWPRVQNLHSGSIMYQ